LGCRNDYYYNITICVAVDAAAAGAAAMHTSQHGEKEKLYTV